MRVAVIGSGYVGLVAGTCFADAGHYVTCVEKDLSKLESLRKGKIPIYEPGLEELLKQCHSRMKFTDDLKLSVEDNDVLFITVGTPESADGTADLGPTMGVVQGISKYANSNKVVVLKSTVPVGTAKEVQKYFDSHSKAPIEVVNNPEFLKEGTALNDFLKPDRVVIGCRTDRAAQMMKELYEPFVKNGNPILIMDNASAELTKYAANSFLALKISFINELARMADAVGADIDQVRKGFTSDSRINPAFFYPGIGYGGSCFPKDVKALVQTAHKLGLPMETVRAADQANQTQREYFFEKIKNHFGSLKGKTLALWGLSFKPRTDDVREAPALDLIKWLHRDGATVKAFDPIAGFNALQAIGSIFQLAPTPYDAVVGADALIIVTEWNEFRNPDLSRIKEGLKTPVIFDGRNIFDPLKLSKLGFTYFCEGRTTVGRNSV